MLRETWDAFRLTLDILITLKDKLHVQEEKENVDVEFRVSYGNFMRLTETNNYVNK